MRRRAFIFGLGAAAVWSFSAHAQGAGKINRVGVLRIARLSTTSAAAWNGFFDALRAAGFRPNDNLATEMRWVDDDERGPAAVAAEVVRSGPDVLVVEGSEAYLQAAIAAAPSLPIVMASGNYDPIERGYIKSLARPGSNITGVFVRRPELAEKQVDLLAQSFPDRRRLGLLWDQHSADQYSVSERVATRVGFQVRAHKLGPPPYDIDAAFRDLLKGAPQLLLVQSSPLFIPHGARICELAVQHRLPTMFITRSYVEFGGLMAYGPDRVAATRLAGTYVARILSGHSPAELPVEQPTKYELLLNLKTAKALGLEFPPTLLALADEVIE